MAGILSWLEGIMRTARDDYGVNPVVFLAIYLVCVPIFYYALFRTLRALAGRRVRELLLWSAVFLGTNVAPFLYVILLGRNIPWWVYLVIAILIGQGVLSLVLKLRKERRVASFPNSRLN